MTYGLEAFPFPSAEVSSSADRAAFVRWIQGSLNRVVGTGLAVDGIMGPRTRQAIQRFQVRQGLRPDGIVGPRTREALLRAGAPPRPGTLVPPAATTPVGERTCPEPARFAVDRCLTPGTQRCPPIPDLLCLKEVDGIPFEYPTRIQMAASGLLVVTQRTPRVQQRFVPAVRDALRGFVGNMTRFGMPIEAILTAGSLYCRCVTGTDVLSNHSYGDAIDVTGVRWSPAAAPPGSLRETIVHNYLVPGERSLLRRINACLRLTFETVIDYHRADHRDHFHCDMNRGQKRNPWGKTTVVFVQEALSRALGRTISETGKLDAPTQRALQESSGAGPELFKDARRLNETLDRLFERVAAGP